jgi:hypothetical protein
MFDTNDSPIQAVLTSFASDTTTLNNNLKAMLDKKSNAGQRGTFQQIDTIVAEKLMEEINKLPEEVPKPETMEKGFRPFVSCIRKNTMRLGATSYPLAGVGGFLVAIDPVCVCLIKASTLMDKADMKVLDQFDSAMEDKKIVKENWPLAILTAGQSMWVPFSSIPLVCTIDETASFLVVPWSIKSLMDGIDSEVADLLLRPALKYGKKHSTEAPWADIVAALETVVQQS